MEAFRLQGRRVVLVGDLNIAPAPIDTCDSGTGAEQTAWVNRKDRRLLQSYLQPQGSYWDVFRGFHPHR